MMDIDQLEDRIEKDKEQAAENVKRHREVLNRLLSTEDGRFFYKALSKYCGLFSAPSGQTNDGLRESNAKRAVILDFILPFIDKDLRRELND